MAFTIAGVLIKALGEFGVAGLAQQVQDFLVKAEQSYPDAADRIKAVETFLKTQLQDKIDVVAMEQTLAGLAADLVRGTAGVDPKGWMLTF